MNKKLLAALFAVSAVFGPSVASASSLPGLSYCAIAKFIGVTYVMSCEGE